MFAPAALRCRVTASLSASVTPGAGAGSNAEPPPEISTKQSRRARGCRRSAESLRVPRTPSAVGSLTPAGRAGCSRTRVSGRDAIGRHIDPAARPAFRRAPLRRVPARARRPCRPRPCRRRRWRSVGRAPGRWLRRRRAAFARRRGRCSSTSRSERTASSPACQIASPSRRRV